MARVKWFLTGIFVLCFVPPLATAQSYTVIDLGTLPGAGFSEGLGINAFGRIAGCSDLAANSCISNLSGNAFLWSEENGMRDLGTLPDAPASMALAVNDFDHVAGLSYTKSRFDTNAILWAEGKRFDLGTLPGGQSSYATGINDFDLVVGSSLTALEVHAFLWSKREGMTDLGTVPGGNYAAALAINLFGRVVGYSNSAPGGNFHAFLWTHSQGMRDLGTLPAGGDSAAYSINDLGQIAGYSSSNGLGSSLHAVVWTDDLSVHDLGTLPGGTTSIASSINFFGKVVGHSDCAGCESTHAFLWSRAKGMRDLNNEISAKSGWTLTKANAINDRGQITGTGSINGQVHAFLLKPVE